MKTRHNLLKLLNKYRKWFKTYKKHIETCQILLKTCSNLSNIPAINQRIKLLFQRQACLPLVSPLPVYFLLIK